MAWRRASSANLNPEKGSALVSDRRAPPAEPLGLDVSAMTSCVIWLGEVGIDDADRRQPRPSRASRQNASMKRRWLTDRRKPSGNRSAVACSLRSPFTCTVLAR